jgi:hypothetical protein
MTHCIIGATAPGRQTWGVIGTPDMSRGIISPAHMAD